MATNIYTDAANRTKNMSSSVPNNSKGPEIGCGYCNNPQCSGHHKGPKKKEAQLIQRIEGNEKLDWRHRIDDPNAFVAEDAVKKRGQVQHALRENPGVKGAVKNERANVIGSRVRLSYEPDYMALGQSLDWAMEIAARVEDLFFHDNEDPVYCWTDASGSQTHSEQTGLAFMELVGTGEVFGMFTELPKKGANHRPVDTAFSFIDVSRLSEPLNRRNRPGHVMGRDIDRFGRVKKFWVADEMPGCGAHNRFSRMARARNLNYTGVKPFNEWNSPQCVHWFDKERAGQHRALPDLASALRRIGMMNTLDDTVIDAAVRDASFSMWIESDAPNLGQAFSQNPGMSPGQYIEDLLGAQGLMQNKFYKNRNLELKAGSGRIPQLMTTERINSIQPGSPGQHSVSFSKSMKAAIARSVGVDPYTWGSEFEGVNFSTVRAALIQTWQNRKYKRDQIFNHICTPRFAVWFEEKISRGQVRMPIGSNRTLSHLNYFYNNRRAMTMATFTGPGEQQIDQIKGFRAQAGALECGLQNRSNYYLQYTDTTFRKSVEKMAYEEKILRENGLDHFIKGSNGKPIETKNQSDRVGDGTSDSRDN